MALHVLIKGFQVQSSLPQQNKTEAGLPRGEKLSILATTLLNILSLQY